MELDELGDAIVAAGEGLSDVTDVEPAAPSSGDTSGAADRFADGIVGANESVDRRYAREQEVRNAPPPAVDTTPAVYAAMGSDRAELESFIVENPHVARLLGTEYAASDEELARNIALVETLRAGQEAREDLEWSEQAEAVEEARSLWEEDAAPIDALNAAAQSGDQEAFQELAEEIATEDPLAWMTWQQAAQQQAAYARNMAIVQQQIAERNAEAARLQAAAGQLEQFLAGHPDAKRHVPTMVELIGRGDQVAPEEFGAAAAGAYHAAKEVERGSRELRKDAFADRIVTAAREDGKPVYQGAGFNSQAEFDAQRAELHARRLAQLQDEAAQGFVNRVFNPPPVTHAQFADGIVAEHNANPIARMFDDLRTKADSDRRARDAA
jgi:hypothetical protein